MSSSSLHTPSILRDSVLGHLLSFSTLSLDVLIHSHILNYYNLITPLCNPLSCSGSGVCHPRWPPAPSNCSTSQSLCSHKPSFLPEHPEVTYPRQDECPLNSSSEVPLLPIGHLVLLSLLNIFSCSWSQSPWP